MGDIALEGGGLIYLENGHTLGQELEQGFYDRAKETGLTEEEAKNAFNRNMMGGGLLADGAKEFSQLHNRRWLVTDYEAGDLVLHTPYTVCDQLSFSGVWRESHRTFPPLLTFLKQIHASTVNHSPDNKIRLGTDLRFVDASRPYDVVSGS